MVNSSILLILLGLIWYNYIYVSVWNSAILIGIAMAYILTVYLYANRQTKSAYRKRALWVSVYALMMSGALFAVLVQQPFCANTMLSDRSIQADPLYLLVKAYELFTILIT